MDLHRLMLNERLPVLPIYVWQHTSSAPMMRLLHSQQVLDRFLIVNCRKLFGISLKETHTKKPIDIKIHVFGVEFNSKQSKEHVRIR